MSKLRGGSDEEDHNKQMDELLEYQEQYHAFLATQPTSESSMTPSVLDLEQSDKPVSIVWATPEIDAILGYIARVSNPDNQRNRTVSQLLSSMLNEGHWSPFTMANICLEINTTRDISRQLLRHSSIHPQEFSQRYQDVGKLPPIEPRECRMQDSKNRQASLPVDNDEGLEHWWNTMQIEVQDNTKRIYDQALQFGIAKEVARAILPEGLTPTRLYMNGNIRSWLTFLIQRLDWTTQQECRELAYDVESLLIQLCPTVMDAFANCRAGKNIRLVRPD